MVLLDEHANELWIVDLKSCGSSPLARLTACPDEFQTQLYCAVTDALLHDSSLQRRFGLPRLTSLGGMLHIAVRKPTIECGLNDRDFTIDDSPLKSGPRKGKPRNEKVYLGEPRFENYLRRVTDWYRAAGDFADRAAEWAIDPPVNISRTPLGVLREPVRHAQFLSRLDLVASFARRVADPRLFAPGEPVRYGQPDSVYAPFRAAPTEAWPALIEAHGFVVRDRDVETGEVVRPRTRSKSPGVRRSSHLSYQPDSSGGAPSIPRAALVTS